MVYDLGKYKGTSFYTVSLQFLIFHEAFLFRSFLEAARIYFASFLPPGMPFVYFPPGKEPTPSPQPVVLGYK